MTAVDVSADALALARENAERNDLAGRVELLHGDLLAPVAGRRFDLIAANLPYVARGDAVDPEVAARAGGPRGVRRGRRPGDPRASRQPT